MPLTPEERARCKTHTGYGNVTLGASLAFGMARPIQTMFIIEDAMNLINEFGVARVRNVLGILDQIECRLVAALPLLQGESIGDLKPNLSVCSALEGEYVRWADRLSDELMVPRYPFSRRFSGLGPGMAGNVRVARGRA